MTAQVGSGLLRAILDAVHGADELIGGQAVTRLRIGLDAGDTEILVDSTVGFGEYRDGTGDGRVVVGGEIIDCAGRTLDSFTGLTRGLDSTRVRERYPANTVVYDLSQNRSALDWVRRGFLVRFAIGSDLDQVGRNLGLHRCPGLIDDTWRKIIEDVAYLAKQPPSAIIAALDALQGPGNYFFYERAVTSPQRFFVSVDVPQADSLQGRFFLNSGEPQLTGVGGVFDVDYDIVSVPFLGAVALGNLRVVGGGFLIDGETFILDDGANPAVTFEFDDDGSVVESPTLRQVVFAASDTEEQLRDAIIAAITVAPTLDIAASILDAQRVLLTHQTIGVAGNQAIVETVADPIFLATGMAGGFAVGVQGVLGVFDDTPATRDGMREGFTNYFTGGSFVGTEITLGTDPGSGTAVLVDYNSHPSHYLAPDAAFQNDGTDFPPYFADNLLAARCLLDQVRAAGVGVELSVSL